MTLGGASVGDHDLVKPALARQGMELNFWKIAMRPGKPVLHGRLGPMIILGLPGNPVAAFVAGMVFLVPLVRALCGDPNAGRDESEPAILGKALRGNDSRQDYLRATLRPSETGCRSRPLSRSRTPRFCGFSRNRNVWWFASRTRRPRRPAIYAGSSGLIFDMIFGWTGAEPFPLELRPAVDKAAAEMPLGMEWIGKQTSISSLLAAASTAPGSRATPPGAALR